MPGSKTRRVALFVDGDNLPPSLAVPILRAAERLGQVDVRRVYGAECGFRAWQDAPGYRPIRVGGAKNGTDLLLCIEAVELACQGGFDAFALASDDRDFSHLAHWLRERGTHVLGLGTGKSSTGWQAVCSGFEILKAPAPVQQTIPKPDPARSEASTKKPAVLTDTDAKIRDLIRDEGENGSIEMSRLGGRMGALHKVTLAVAEAKSWRAYLDQRRNLYDLDPKSVTARVRWIGP